MLHGNALYNIIGVIWSYTFLLFQHNFKILSRKMEVAATYGNHVSNKTNFRVEMYNESMPVINGKLYLLKDFPPSLKVKSTFFFTFFL